MPKRAMGSKTPVKRRMPLRLRRSSPGISGIRESAQATDTKGVSDADAAAPYFDQYTASTCSGTRTLAFADLPVTA